MGRSGLFFCTWEAICFYSQFTKFESLFISQVVKNHLEKNDYVPFDAIQAGTPFIDYTNNT